VGGVGGRCEVAVVGLGPVGCALAALLGDRGVDVIAIDPAAEPFPYPRAIAADDETLRTLLRIPGLRDPIRLFDAGRVEVRGPRGALLTTVAFEGSPLGVPGLSFFHQPSLERELRAALALAPGVRQGIGRSVIGVRDDGDGVRLSLDDGDAVTAQWVVGCDGAASVVRGQRGIAFTGRTFAEPWIVIDVDCPQPLDHLRCFTYVLDPRRPAVNMPRPGGHRFEFMVLPGEDPAAMAGPGQVELWLRPYLATLTPTERSRLQIVRAAVYAYHARTAARWRDGRVLLAGDAAHCMPPFGGQGLGAGVGDALTLAWRLDEVRRGVSPPRLLDGYERERRPRVAAMTRTALTAGRLLTATSAPRAAVTRLGLRAVDAAPVLGPRFRAGSLRAKPRIPAPDGEPCGGLPLPNPRVRTRDGRLVRLDDVLAAGWALLGRGADPWPLVGPALAEALRARGCLSLAVCHPGALAATAAVAIGCEAIEDLDGTLLALWRGRPAAATLVRPDRFLAIVAEESQVAAAFARLTGQWRPADDVRAFRDGM
jgi:3-(3-hydroxy-phenyl)propionate hydroxylase